MVTAFFVIIRKLERVKIIIILIIFIQFLKLQEHFLSMGNEINEHNFITDR